MPKIRFAIVGSGFRAECFIRTAQALSDRFEIVAMLFRTKEKARVFAEKYGIFCTTDREAVLAKQPDFVVVAVNYSSIFSVSREFLELGIPVLAETPAGATVEELNELWTGHSEKGWKVQVAEQYQFHPKYAAVIEQATSGKLGARQHVFISAFHGYHSASMFRLVLGLRNEAFRVFGKSYDFEVTETDSRYGLITDGRMVNRVLTVLTLEFEKGMKVFHQFSDVQYRSTIRARHLVVQGTRGEIDDLRLRFVNEANLPEEHQLFFRPDAHLSDDDLAIARCLSGMGHYVAGGPEFYPLSAAIQDAYISILMGEAARSERIVESSPQIWH